MMYSSDELIEFKEETVDLNLNKVSHVNIRGVQMLSLLVNNEDSEERICLSQLSNTLLSKFSYNEIHNRRVALGISCMQCTPAQLELLRRHGAMAASSRRCGMITRREAERLVKSFLDEPRPPALPDTFSFCIEHKCEFGCQGIFYPCRYNSSRAKCIRCMECKQFFSPNKFVFHWHQTASSVRYQQQKQQLLNESNNNFNSWRKHIYLVNPDNDEHLRMAWEDVKSIFNSGKRKRSAHSSATTTSTVAVTTGGAAVATSLPKQEVIVDEEEEVNAEATYAADKVDPGLIINFMSSILNPFYYYQQYSYMPTWLCNQEAVKSTPTPLVATEASSKKKEYIKFSIDSLIGPQQEQPQLKPN